MPLLRATDPLSPDAVRLSLSQLVLEDVTTGVTTIVGVTLTKAVVAVELLPET